MKGGEREREGKKERARGKKSEGATWRIAVS